MKHVSLVRIECPGCGELVQRKAEVVETARRTASATALVLAVEHAGKTGCRALLDGVAYNRWETVNVASCKYGAECGLREGCSDCNNCDEDHPCECEDHEQDEYDDMEGAA